MSAAPYCAACQEEQPPDEDSNCPVCGGALSAPPQQARQQQQRAPPPQPVAAAAPHEDPFESVSQALASLLSSAREGTPLGPGQMPLLPTFLFDGPGQAATTGSGPANNAAMKLLPRYAVEDDSSWVLHATELVLHAAPRHGKRAEVRLHATLAKFSPADFAPVRGPLLLAQPPLADADLQCSAAEGAVVAVKRGGCTFAAKALRAQAAGAAAVVVLNNCGATLPYVMTDSQSEAAPGALRIPAVMVSEADGARLLQMLSQNMEATCSLSSARASRECVVCQEEYKVGARVVRLPCSHLFHEGCCMSWLSRFSSTCPTCRFDLLKVEAGSSAPAVPQWEDWFG